MGCIRTIEACKIGDNWSKWSREERDRVPKQKEEEKEKRTKKVSLDEEKRRDESI
jgi:hypothetical protein